MGMRRGVRLGMCMKKLAFKLAMEKVSTDPIQELGTYLPHCVKNGHLTPVCLVVC